MTFCVVCWLFCCPCDWLPLVPCVVLDDWVVVVTVLFFAISIHLSSSRRILRPRGATSLFPPHRLPPLGYAPANFQFPRGYFAFHA